MTENKNPRKVKADFHNHIRTASRLSEDDFNRAIETAYQRLGDGGTFGMINFNDKRYEKLISLGGYEREYIGEYRNAVYVQNDSGDGILVVKGQEVPTKQGHLLILGLGYDEHIKQNRTIEDTIKEAKDKNATIVLDHPFFREVGGAGYYFREKPCLLSDIDAIEVHNGEAAIRPLANWRARNLFNTIVTYPTGALSSSDGHSLYELGKSWTEINEIDRENFSESLRKSVQNTKKANRENYSSKIGAIDHMTDMFFVSKVAPKIKLGWMFETERPEN